jgi:3-hydroxyacyl-CoA dehydrogenase
VDVKNRVAIIGAGLIGRSWAIVFAGGAFDVALYDVGLDIAEKARGLVHSQELLAVHDPRHGVHASSGPPSGSRGLHPPSS